MDELGEHPLALRDPRKTAMSFSAYNMYESQIGPLLFPKNAVNNIWHYNKKLIL